MGILNASTVHQFMEQWKHRLQTYKIPILLLCVGILLTCIPLGTSEKKTEEIEEESLFSLKETQTQMESILSSIEGAGTLRLMLTLSSGVQTQYLQDSRQTTTEGSVTRESETVLSSQSSSAKAPVETMQYLPEYQGALVVCEGADSAKVRLAVKEAISSLTGLGSDKITVVKMKQ